MDDDDANSIRVTPALGYDGFVPGAEYRLTPTSDLTCDVATAPPVAWTRVYTFTVRGPPCPADVNGDGLVRADDLFAVLAAWGPCKDCPEDVDDSGTVDFRDLLFILLLWGPCQE